MNTLIGPLPRHLYVYVDSKFTHREPCGLIPAVWFGLVSYPGRMWGCNLLLESGAVYRNIPPHAITFSKTVADWSESDAQRWDCYGWQFTTLEYPVLAGLDVIARVGPHENGGQEIGGTYLFTAAPVGDGYSAAPDQSKEFVFVKLDNGRLTIQPTNEVLFIDKSFTRNERRSFPTGMRRQHEIYHCE